MSDISLGDRFKDSTLHDTCTVGGEVGGARGGGVSGTDRGKEWTGL